MNTNFDGTLRKDGNQFNTNIPTPDMKSEKIEKKKSEARVTTQETHER